MKALHVRDYDLLVIGESFIEFRCDGDVSLCNSYEKDIGGADIVVAATAARLGSGVSLISAIARDPFHAMIRERLLAQGINIDHVITAQGYNGIYFTSSRYPEQREYLVHRPGSAAHDMTPAIIYDDLIDNGKIVYASSELQSISRPARHTVFKAFTLAHSNKTMVAYDPNLRLQRWSLDDAKEALWSVLPLVDVIFPSAPDETKALFGYERPTDVIGFLWDRGVSIVAVKTGANGCTVGYDGRIEEFPPSQTTEPVKSVTLIGSAFIGGFLHSIARGHDPFTAARFANSVALFKGIKGGGICSLPTGNDLKP
ncbi:MAG: sugar kinase [Chitinispirillaceae bacterium]|nr:sugar kinase [Chitinispirillaceae bacterium]